MTQEALKMALYYLEQSDNYLGSLDHSKPIAAIKEALAQEQEPVADDFFRMIADKNPKPFPLPQRTWVGLFDEEIEVLFQTAAGADEEVHIRFARAIESKLKEVNT